MQAQLIHTEWAQALHVSTGAQVTTRLHCSDTLGWLAGPMKHIVPAIIT